MIAVNSSMPELSRFGKTLFNLYYTQSGEDLLNIGIMHHGYPHNGGSHSFTVSHPNPNNVKAFLELYKEQYPNVTEEIDLMIKQLEGFRSGTISLMKSLRTYNPDLIKSISHYDENNEPVYYDEASDE